MNDGPMLRNHVPDMEYEETERQDDRYHARYQLFFLYSAARVQINQATGHSRYSSLMLEALNVRQRIVRLCRGIHWVPFGFGAQKLAALAVFLVRLKTSSRDC